MRTISFDDDSKHRSFAADYQRYAGLKLLPLQPLPGKLTLPLQQAAGAAKSPRSQQLLNDMSVIQAKLQLPALSTKVLSAIPQRTLLVYANVRPAGLRSRQRENASSRGSPNAIDLERARSQGPKERPPQQPLPAVAAPASKGAKASTWPAAVPLDAPLPSYKALEPSRGLPARSTTLPREGGSVVSDHGGALVPEKLHREPMRASSSQRVGNGAPLHSSSSASRPSGASPQRFGRSGAHRVGGGSSRSPEKQRKARPRSGRRVRPPASREPALVAPHPPQFFMVSGEPATMSDPAPAATPASRRSGAAASNGDGGGALPPVGGRLTSHADASSSSSSSRADASSHHARPAGPKPKKSEKEAKGDANSKKDAAAVSPAAAAAAHSHAPDADPTATAADTGADPADLAALPAIPEQEQARHGAAAASGGGGTAEERAGDATASSSGAEPEKKLLHKRFRMEKVIGEGAYGVVLKCTDVRTGATVALKQFKISGPDADDVRRTSAREVSILRQFRHPNIVAFIDEFQEAAEKVYVVMEYVPKNLLELLEESQGGLDKPVVRSLIRQLCRAVGYLHKQSVLYRDVKPENILVDSAGNLKLCDFGFARKWAPADVLTDYVATRWYRAPELLLGPPFVNAQGAKVRSQYGPPADVWAVGCIIGELIDGEPMFAGDSDLDQLHRIMTLRGAITQPQLQMFNTNPHHSEVRIPLDSEQMRSDGSLFQQRYLGKMTEAELEFTMRLLEIDPERRPTAEEALQLQWLREKQDERDPEVAMEE